MATSKKTGGSAKKPAKKAAPKKSAAKTGVKTTATDESVAAADTTTHSAVAAGVPHESVDPAGGEVRRRDFINIAAVSFAGVGGAVVVLPLISQMSASADVMALASVEVDVSAIMPGQAIKTTWRKQPVFIRNLLPAEVAQAKASDKDPMPDPQTLDERTLPGHENWLVTLGVCTHLGCVPTGAAQGEVKGDYGGYFCPCHGSHYDLAGRIRKGPAPSNLEVPKYSFLSDTVIQIG